jgi:hypothetical protein
MDKISGKVAVTREKISLRRRSKRNNVLLKWYESACSWVVMIQHRNKETQDFDSTALRLFKKDGSKGWKFRRAEHTPTRGERMEMFDNFIKLNCKMDINDFVEAEAQAPVYKFATFVIDDEDDFCLCSDGNTYWIEATFVCPALGILINYQGGKALRKSLARSRFWADFNKDYQGVHIDGLDDVASED